MAHLADFDPILADRMKRVIAEDKPTLVGADENRFAAALAYHDRDLEEELTIIEATRSQLARILRNNPPMCCNGSASTANVGRTLEQLLTRDRAHQPPCEVHSRKAAGS